LGGWKGLCVSLKLRMYTTNNTLVRTKMFPVVTLQPPFLTAICPYKENSLRENFVTA